MEDLPIHPILVHFPVALFTTALILEILSLIFKNHTLHRSAFYVYISATLFAPLAVLTGLREAQEWHLVSHPVLKWHRLFALTTMWTAIAALPMLGFLKIISEKVFRIIFFILLIVLVSLVSLTGYNGGRLVYEYGIGVEK